jgi:netrin-G3 ligand
MPFTVNLKTKMELIGVLFFTFIEFPQGYPKIIVNPELKSVEKEKPTIMQCQADANGHKFDIEWFKNGVPVDLGDSKRLTITRTGTRISEQVRTGTCMSE